MKSVKKLPIELCSLVRSGVIITTPAQAVVELVLNSIDAESTSIAVRVDLQLYKIQVIDNGHGISQSDLEAIGNRSVTSKCYSMDEFQNNLKFHGCRGEALASLREMCGLLDIVTATSDENITHRKLFVHGKEGSVKVCDVKRPSSGTTVTITDLMFNMPVRRQKIKATVELESIRSCVECIALVHPEISISVRNDTKNKIILEKPKSTNISKAFEQFFGQNVAKTLAPVNYSSQKLKISGYIGKEAHRHKYLQFIYVNRQSIIKTKLQKIVAALLSRSAIIRTNGPWKSKPIPNDFPVEKWLSFTTLEKPKRFPVFVINIECARSEYELCRDSKQPDVYFKNWDNVVSCLTDAIKRFLRQEKLVEEEDEEDEERQETEAIEINNMISSHSYSDPPECQMNYQQLKEFDSQHLHIEIDSKREGVDQMNSEADLETNVNISKECEIREVEVKRSNISDKLDKFRFVQKAKLSSTTNKRINQNKSSSTESLIERKVRRCMSLKMSARDIEKEKKLLKKNVNSCLSSSKFLPQNVANSKSREHEISNVGLCLSHTNGSTNNLQSSVDKVSDDIEINDPFDLGKSVIIKENNGHLVGEMECENRNVTGRNNLTKEYNTLGCILNEGQESSLDEVENFLCRFEVPSSNDSFPKESLTTTIEIFDSKKSGNNIFDKNGLNEHNAAQLTCTENISTKFPIDTIELVNDAFSISSHLLPQFHMDTSQNEIPKKVYKKEENVQLTNRKNAQSESSSIANILDFCDVFEKCESLEGVSEYKSPYFASNKGASPSKKQLNSHYFKEGSIPKLSMAPITIIDVRSLSSPKLSVVNEDEEGTCSKRRRLSQNDSECLSIEYSPSVNGEEHADCVKINTKYDKAMNWVRTSDDTENMGMVKWRRKLDTLNTDKVDVSVMNNTAQNLSLISAKMSNILLQQKFDKRIFKNLRIISQLDNKFIVTLCSLESSSPHVLGVFDQHAVHERIRLETLMKEYTDSEDEGSFKNTELSESIVLSVNSQEIHVMSNFQSAFEKLGFYYKVIDPPNILVHRIPTCLYSRFLRERKQGWLEETLHDLIQDVVQFVVINDGQDVVVPEVFKDVVNSEACKGAIKFGDPLSSEQCEELISQLSRCDLPFYCAHGRPSFMPLIDLRFIEEMKKECSF